MRWPRGVGRGEHTASPPVRPCLGRRRPATTRAGAGRGRYCALRLYVTVPFRPADRGGSGEPARLAPPTGGAGPGCHTRTALQALRRPHCGGYACVLTPVYLPTLTTRYGRADEYADLNGTPVSSLIVWAPQDDPFATCTYTWPLVTATRSPGWWVSAWYAWRHVACGARPRLSHNMPALGASLAAALAVPLVVVSMPPLALCQAWGSPAPPCALAGLVTGAGSLSVGRALVGRPHRWHYLAAEAGCAVVSTAAYQLSAMMC